MAPGELTVASAAPNENAGVGAAVAVGPAPKAGAADADAPKVKDGVDAWEAPNVGAAAVPNMLLCAGRKYIRRRNVRP